MNVTRAVAVQQTVDVLPTPQSPKADPLAAAGRSTSPRPQAYLRHSDVMRQIHEAVAKSNADEQKTDAKSPASDSSTASRPGWLRKVQAWLDGRWGIGHRRKES